MGVQYDLSEVLQPEPTAEEIAGRYLDLSGRFNASDEFRTRVKEIVTSLIDSGGIPYSPQDDGRYESYVTGIVHGYMLSDFIEALIT